MVEDLATVESLGEPVVVPCRTFSDTLKTLELTPLEPEARESKHHARGVGLVLVIDRTTGEREQLVSVR
jgi:hypothetical protein